MLSSLMPQRKEFYVLLATLSDRVVAGANATLRLLNGLGNNAEDLPTLVAEVSLLEQAGDKIKAQVVTLLHRSFTTPINRDQIHSLVIELDAVLNALEDVARAVTMYNIKESTAEARELASLGADACMRLNRAVAGLAEKGRRPEVIGFCKEIEEIEAKADSPSPACGASSGSRARRDDSIAASRARRSAELSLTPRRSSTVNARSLLRTPICSS